MMNGGKRILNNPAGNKLVADSFENRRFYITNMFKMNSGKADLCNPCYIYPTGHGRKTIDGINFYIVVMFLGV